MALTDAAAETPAKVLRNTLDTRNRAFLFNSLKSYAQ